MSAILLSWLSLYIRIFIDQFISRELRNWIDKENKKYIERNKEAKETIIAAKKKVFSSKFS